MEVLIVLCLDVEFLRCLHLVYVFIFLVWVTECPPTGITTAYDIFS